MLRVNRDELGLAIKEARDDAHLTQAELARLVGVSPRTVQNWEAGRITPQARHRRALLKVLEPQEAA